MIVWHLMVCECYRASRMCAMVEFVSHRAFGSVAEVQVNVSKIVGPRPRPASRWLLFMLEAKSPVCGSGVMEQYGRQ
jgi:hypothetical protein